MNWDKCVFHPFSIELFSSFFYVCTCNYTLGHVLVQVLHILYFVINSFTVQRKSTCSKCGFWQTSFIFKLSCRSAGTRVHTLDTFFFNIWTFLFNPWCFQGIFELSENYPIEFSRFQTGIHYVKNIQNKMSTALLPWN